jgi:hypothetical protein
MHWKEINDTVACALDNFPLPAYMIIHCGSNNLTEVKTADLIHDISADITTTLLNVIVLNSKPG